MPRYLLAAYMLLLSVTGPNLCCCSLAQMTVFFGGTSQPSKGLGVAPLDCCAFTCCQEPPQSVSTDDSDESEQPNGISDENTPRHHCRCRHLANAADPRPTTEFAVELNRSWVFAIQHMPVSVLVPMTCETDTASGLTLAASVPYASRSGREIRIDFHAWRC